MSPKKTAVRKPAKSVERRPAKPKKIDVPPGVVILMHPQGCGEIPRIVAENGTILAAGVVVGGKVLSVRGVVLGANARIPTSPPARAIAAKLRRGGDSHYPGGTSFEFVADSRSNARLPIHEFGLNNRLVVWADFKGSDGSVMGHVCLQFEALRAPTAPPDDSHEVSAPMRGIVGADGSIRLTKARIVPAGRGGYLLDTCTLTKTASSSAITGLRAKIYGVNPTGIVDPNSLSAPFVEKSLPAGVSTYTLDSSTVQVPGASLGKNNYLYVWAKFASGTDYQLAAKGCIQFEGV
jgi:hypothetical protein